MELNWWGEGCLGIPQCNFFNFFNFLPAMEVDDMYTETEKEQAEESVSID